jgi:hypothetical protein
MGGGGGRGVARANPTLDKNDLDGPKDTIMKYRSS